MGGFTEDSIDFKSDRLAIIVFIPGPVYLI